MIAAKALSKHYRMGTATVRAVDQLDLEVAAGETVAILGPSGSGKSTLMHLLGGLDSPTQGSIAVAGTELARIDDAARSSYRLRTVGFVFQSFHLIPHLTARENVELPLKLAGRTSRERRERSAALIQEVGLAGREAHRPWQLSGGERQRVAVARALANGPSLFLADEPTGNLDSRTGNEIVELLLALNAAQRLTLVVVTHNPQVAGRMSREIRLEDGRIAEDVKRG